MKNVHHHVGEVGNDPLAGRESIHRERFYAVVLLQAVAQFRGDGFQMRLGSAGADDEEIREAGNAAEIDGQDVLGFLFRDEVGAEAGE